MVPDIPLRLQTMLRSMTDTIIPSIPKDEALSTEQAYLVVAHLRLIADQIDRMTQFQLAELKDFANLNRTLSAAAQGGEATTTAVRRAQESLGRAQPLTETVLPSASSIEAMIYDLRGGADALVKAAFEDGSEAFRVATGRLVADQALRQLTRDRILTRTTGFDANAAHLPAADTVLA